MAKILGIGNSVLDIVLTTEHFVAEDQECRANTRQSQLGGNVANNLNVLTQLGHQTAICTSLGGDSEAKNILKQLQQCQISTHFVQTFLQGKTPTSYITLNQEKGSRTIVHYRDCPEVSFDFFAKIEVEDFDWLHFEARNMDALPGMLNIAKTFLDSQPISLEVEKDREGIEACLPLANVIFFSHHFAQQRGFTDGETLLTAMKSLAPQSHLICTWGSQGAWFLEAGKEAIQHQPAQKIKVIDSLGAGDTFNAGVIHALSHGDCLKDAVQAGSDLAARKCQQQGLTNLLTPLKVHRPLGNIKQVTNAKTLVVKTEQHPYEIILIKGEQQQIKAYENNCPHQNVPLTEAYKIDVNPFEKTMKCSVHEAFFNIEDGECIEGPCLYEHLTEVPIQIDEQGDIYLN